MGIRDWLFGRKNVLAPGAPQRSESQKSSEATPASIKSFWSLSFAERTNAMCLDCGTTVSKGSTKVYICGKCGYLVCLRCMGEMKTKCPKCRAEAAMVFDGRGLQSAATINSLESIRSQKLSSGAW
jgi:Zn finger protein HypA/HybF involved in hydrogenase expression